MLPPGNPNPLNRHYDLITSADEIYHLERIGTDRYRRTPTNGLSEEIRIEDTLMKPLVSGPEAKRYQEPETDTYLLFPYEQTAGGGMQLIPAAEMARRFPLGWDYLTTWESKLRGREGQSFDDDEWFRFGRNQNLDKQDMIKLVVAQTVPSMRVSADSTGTKYLNNVRVNGILAAKGSDPFFLLGVLNGPVADFVFQRIGKPKNGGFLEANKQFIEPLPIPDAPSENRTAVADLARELQARHTRRRDLRYDAARRLSVLPRTHSPRPGSGLTCPLCRTSRPARRPR